MALPSRPARAVLLAVAVTLAWCAFFPLRLTDGDSSLFAALATEMADGGLKALLAPHWAFQGGAACFHEHPPGAFWPAAFLQMLGMSDSQAPLVANALWLWLLVLGAWKLGGRFMEGGGPGLGPLIAGILLLHYPMLKYVVRAGLEIPFAACTVGCVAAVRSPARTAPLWLGLAFFGALMTRGIFAFAIPLLLLADAFTTGPHSLAWKAKVVAGLLLGALLAAVYDAGHAWAAGHGFWEAYTERQVLPSLQADGTPHPNATSTGWYYLTRLLLYAAPWWIIGLAATARVRARPSLRVRMPDLMTGLAWVLVFAIGIVLARRQGSRYLFAVWPATAWMTAIALSDWWRGIPPARRRLLALAVLALPPALTAGKTLVTPRDDWWQAAGALREARDRLPPPEEQGPGFAVYGPFAGHDDRLKQFVRHHLGVWAFREPAEGAPPGSLLLVGPDSPMADAPAAFLHTGLFTLLRVAPGR